MQAERTPPEAQIAHCEELQSMVECGALRQGGSRLGWKRLVLVCASSAPTSHAVFARVCYNQGDRARAFHYTHTRTALAIARSPQAAIKQAAITRTLRLRFFKSALTEDHAPDA
eukprot:982547-Pelagomonas_calceolata.AAC.1